MGVVGALVAAAVGAVAWGLIAQYTGFEVGYVAWGIGAAIGFISALLGSGGVPNGVLCAVLALVAVGAGKLLGSYWTAEKDYREYYVEDWLSEESYQDLQQEATAFAQVKSEQEYPKFIVDNNCIGATTVEEVTKEDIEGFKEYHAEELKWIAQEKPTYEAWRAHEEPRVKEYAAEAAKDGSSILTFKDHVDFVRENLNAIDILFAVLGVASAFALGKGKEDMPV